jgi:hypothetical protein
VRFFRNSDKQSVLNLNADETAQAAEMPAAAVGIFASSQTNLSIEDKVKQYFEQLREPVFRYLTATFGGEHAQAEEITQKYFCSFTARLPGERTFKTFARGFSGSRTIWRLIKLKSSVYRAAR